MARMFLVRDLDHRASPKRCSAKPTLFSSVHQQLTGHDWPPTLAYAACGGGGLSSPSSQACVTATVFQPSAIRFRRFCDAGSLAISASSTQLSALSNNCCVFVMAAPSVKSWHATAKLGNWFQWFSSVVDKMTRLFCHARGGCGARPLWRRPVQVQFEVPHYGRRIRQRQSKRHRSD